MNWTRQKPKEPGWYWCRNHGDRPGEVWEAVIRISETSSGLVGSWMTAPGEVGIMHESEFSPACLWAGPIEPPVQKI